MRYQGKVTVHADRKDVWDFMLDVDKFAACMPGVENLKLLDDRTFEGVMRAKVGPVSGEFGFQAQIVDSEAPVRLSAQVEGTDTLTNSTMTADIHMQLAEAGSGETEVTYESEVKIKGRLAIIGDMVIRATGAQVIEEFFKRLRERVEGAAANQ